MSKQSDEEFLKVYKKLIIGVFVAIRIQSGGTKKAREYSHLFVQGHHYGGKLGRLLCNKGFKEKQAVGAADLERDLCPKCRDQLTKLGRILIDMRQRELFLVKGGEKPASLTPKEILDILIALRTSNMPQEKPTPYVKEALFDDTDLNQPVRMTSLCPMPLP